MQATQAYLDKEEIKTMKLTLANICKHLDIAFKLLETQLRKGQIKKAVLAIGNTGCGKSTLLSAIILGPDCLQEVDIQYEVPS